VEEIPQIDTTIPHSARVYDYLLGGKDNFEADRIVAKAAMEAFPATAESARANRVFLSRVVRYLVAEAGIRQFLDLGSGLPAADNVHEVAQSVDPQSRVVYVDNDPIVHAHARALLVSAPAGATAYLHADLRDRGPILEQAAKTLDFGQPVAVLLLGILHFIPDSDDPAGIVKRLADALPEGSYLVISQLAADIDPAMTAGIRAMKEQGRDLGFVLRDKGQVTAFFDGLALVEPGVVPIARWRPRTEEEAQAPGTLWGAVARKQGPLQDRAELGEQSSLRAGADDLGDHLAVAEDAQRRHREDRVPLRGHLIVVHVHLGDDEFPAQFHGDLLKDGREHVAGRAPLRPEVDQDRRGRGQDEVSERVIGYRDDEARRRLIARHLMCHHFLFSALPVSLARTTATSSQAGGGGSGRCSSRLAS
jgi:SAM-dependent methyltransferase